MIEVNYSGKWSAADFFERLTATNKLTREHGFVFCRVSGLQGFLDVISANSSAPNVIAVDDTSEGYARIDNSPHRSMVKSVYMSMRHKAGDQNLRELCLTIMAEIFRQFMSKLILERTQLQQQLARLDPRIAFSEIDKYFCAGSACAYFQLSIDLDTDMRYNPDEWLQ